MVSKENQEAVPTKKTAKKRGRKKKELIVKDNEPLNNDNQQNITSAPKITAKRKAVVSAPKTTAKRKAVASASKTTAKRNNRKETVSNDDTIQEPAAINESSDEDINIQDNEGSDEDVNTQSPAAVANASISKLLEISDDDDDLSEGKSFKIIFDDIIQILFISYSHFYFLRWKSS